MAVKEMLEAGVHFGHQTSQWNPAMKPYIFGARNGVHIIDLQKTDKLFAEARQFMSRVVSEGGNLLIVGTKRQAQAVVEDEAKRAQMFYVNRRWLGGTLTNFRTIKASIDRLKDLEKKRDEGSFEKLTKKERLGIEREIQDLSRSLGGIKEMTRLPAALFLIDATKEHIALSEANRLGIPVVAVADTDCNPVGVDYLIPGNDDAIKSIRYFCKEVADACLEGLAERDLVLSRKVRGGETDAETLPRERLMEGKGRAYVSKPDAYEKTVDGEYSQKDAYEEVTNKEGESS